MTHLFTSRYYGVLVFLLGTTVFWLCLIQTQVYFGQTLTNQLKRGPPAQLVRVQAPVTPKSPPELAQVLRIYDHNPISWRRHVDYYNFSECRYTRCGFTSNPRHADLIMVNAARIKNYSLPARRPGALLMMYTKEPPTFKRFHHLNRTDMRGSVNWTRCVYADSTFQAHYNSIVDREPPAGKDYEAIFRRKRLTVAWFVTHCETQSRREEYVRRMSSEIQVDIFGRCGNLSCGKYGFQMGGQRDKCLEMLSADYKFYISFENSMCSDYVTEKFYNMYDNVDIVPVVRGGAKYGQLVSRDTYVDANDFPSPEHLGRYLRRLGGDRARYIQMLQEKDRYLMVPPREKFHCTLCKALHTRRQIYSVYSDFYKWLVDHCWQPTDL